MAVRNWHVGKIVLLWAWGLVLLLVCVDRLRATESALPGMLLLFCILIVPIALSVLTWRWLSGKERPTV